jgi:hypothetical protein
MTVCEQERLIVQREQAKGSYGTTPYFLAKLAAELPVGSLFPLLFGALMYPLTGLHASWARFAKFSGEQPASLLPYRTCTFTPTIKHTTPLPLPRVDFVCIAPHYRNWVRCRNPSGI